MGQKTSIPTEPVAMAWAALPRQYTERKEALRCTHNEGHGGGGVTGPGSLTPTPPSPNPSLEIGRKVPDHRSQRRRKQILLNVAKGKEMCFHPMRLYSIYSKIFRRIQKWTKTRFQLAQNQFPISEHHLPEMATLQVGGTLHLQLESRRCKSWCWQK